MIIVPENIVRALKSKKMIARLVSFILAVLLWAFISHTRTGAITFKVPVEIRSVPSTMMVTAVSDRSVVVTMEGPRKNIRNADLKSVKAYVEVKKPVPGELKKYRVRIFRDSIHDEIQVRLSRKYVNIMTDLKVGKTVPVFPRIGGNADPEAVVGRVSVKPDRITITGPERELNGVDRIFTETVFMAGEKESILRQVQLRLDEDGGLDFSETKATVSIPIYLRAALLKINVPVVVRADHKGFKYTPSVQEISVYLKKNDRVNIKARDLGAYIYLDAVAVKKMMSASGGRSVTREFTVTVEPVNKKEYIDIVSIVPDRVKMRIETGNSGE